MERNERRLPHRFRFRNWTGRRRGKETERGRIGMQLIWKEDRFGNEWYMWEKVRQEIENRGLVKDWANELTVAKKLLEMFHLDLLLFLLLLHLLPPSLPFHFPWFSFRIMIRIFLALYVMLISLPLWFVHELTVHSPCSLFTCISCFHHSLFFCRMWLVINKERIGDKQLDDKWADEWAERKTMISSMMMTWFRFLFSSFLVFAPFFNILRSLSPFEEEVTEVGLVQNSFCIQAGSSFDLRSIS